MNRWLSVMVLVCAGGLWGTTATAGQGGGDQHGGGGGWGSLLQAPPSAQAVLDLIGKHVADLKLTDQQKAKFSELKRKMPAKAAQPAKPSLNDPDLKDLFKKAQEAWKSGDLAGAGDLRQQLQEKMKKDDPENQKLLDEMKNILTPEQREKVKELWAQSGDKAGGKDAAGKDAAGKEDGKDAGKDAGGKAEGRAGGWRGAGHRGPPPLDW